jgi:hypothetical protein
VFLAVFAVYTTIALLMLAMGIVAALAVDPGVRAVLLDWSKAGGISGPLWLAMANAARLSEPVPQIVLDYALSVLYVGCALLLVWKRPNDWVARLLGLALIGTAMGYNYQSHSVIGIAAGAVARGGVPEVRYLNIFHWLFHIVGGVTFVHGLLLFPNGRLVPRWSKWLLIVLYGLTVEEIAYPIFNVLTGTSANPSLIVLIFTELFRVQPIVNFDGLIQSEVVFFVLLFGLLVPVVGIGAQAYRYARESTELERAQTRLVVWALFAAFGSGLLFIALGAVGLMAQGVVFAPTSSFVLEQILLHVSPPLFAVVPVALLLAVFRYRLFDIEIVIDRTMIYAPLTAILALAFLLTLFVIQQVLRSLIGQPSELAVALAAFVNVWLFQPMRRRVQRFIDARFAARDAPRAKPAEAPAT